MLKIPPPILDERHLITQFYRWFSDKISYCYFRSILFTVDEKPSDKTVVQNPLAITTFDSERIKSRGQSAFDLWDINLTLHFHTRFTIRMKATKKNSDDLVSFRECLSTNRFHSFFLFFGWLKPLDNEIENRKSISSRGSNFCCVQ